MSLQRPTASQCERGRILTGKSASCAQCAAVRGRHDSTRLDGLHVRYSFRGCAKSDYTLNFRITTIISENLIVNARLVNAAFPEFAHQIECRVPRRRHRHLRRLANRIIAV